VSFIILEQQQIPFAEIPFISNIADFNDYSQSVLHFCKCWLQKQSNFEITTSGSTGTPQSIVWSRELMLWSINNTVRYLNLKSGMHILHCIDANKAGGMMMLARALYLKMSVEVVHPASNPFTSATSNYYNLASMVPLQVAQLIAESRLDELDRIEVLLVGGASLSNSMINALQNRPTRIYATYGMTETASHIALQLINGVEKKPMFALLPDVKISIGENQCAVITTPFHRQLKTNDRLFLGADGRFQVLGRADNTINSGGVKISLEKVEIAVDIALTSLKLNFFNFCAWKQPDEKLGEALIVIFETATLDTAIELTIFQELSHNLQKYELPKRFYFTSKLVYTTSGKIDRNGTALSVFKGNN